MQAETLQIILQARENLGILTNIVNNFLTDLSPQIENVARKNVLVPFGKKCRNYVIVTPSISPLVLL